MQSIIIPSCDLIPSVLRITVLSTKRLVKLAVVGILNDRSLALHILNNLRRQSALVGETHLGGEGAVGHPFVRGPGSGLLQHAVNLFEREALCGDGSVDLPPTEYMSAGAYLFQGSGNRNR